MKEDAKSSFFNPQKSIKRAQRKRSNTPKWVLRTSKGRFVWGSKMERVAIIRKGLPYETIEVIGLKAQLPIKDMLSYLGVAQTTYNKKKREMDLLSGRDSEAVLVLSELLDFGLEVFNNESDKFQRWLKKPNLALGGIAPKSLFDSLTGIQEVRNELNRIEYGNMA